MRAEARGSRPWHQWLVGLLALFQTGIGALDFVMMHTDRAAWLARLGLGEQAGAYFRDYPLAADLCWAVAVWASFAGAVLLLLRRAAAWAFFVAALIGQRSWLEGVRSPR